MLHLQNYFKTLFKTSKMKTISIFSSTFPSSPGFPDFLVKLACLIYLPVNIIYLLLDANCIFWPSHPCELYKWSLHSILGKCFFWSGPDPGSQELKPVGTSKTLWSPEPRPSAPLQWTTNRQEKGHRDVGSVYF